MNYNQLFLICNYGAAGQDCVIVKQGREDDAVDTFRFLS